MVASAKPASSFRGWMQSTGQTSTHAVSLVPMHGSQMIYAIDSVLRFFNDTREAAGVKTPVIQPSECRAGLTVHWSPGEEIHEREDAGLLDVRRGGNRSG